MIKTAAIIALFASYTIFAQQHPGPLSDGGILLHNGWTLSPAGVSQSFGEYPQAMQLSPNGSMLAILNGGFDSASVSVFNLNSGKVISSVRLPNVSLGICWQGNGRIFASGGYNGCVYQCDFSDGDCTYVIHSKLERAHIRCV